MKHLTILNGFAIFALSLGSIYNVRAQAALKIENTILNDTQSFYYIDFKSYPKSLNNLR